MSPRHEVMLRVAYASLFISLGFALGVMYGRGTGASRAPIVIEKCSDA